MYPISLNPSATFFVLAFAEAGNTYPTFAKFNPFNVKRSLGGGVRVFLPMFGMLGFDYGWGFDTLDPHSKGVGSGNDISRMGGKPVGAFQFIIGANLRSEEHTSELQSRPHLVCRLLLEKKKIPQSFR